MAPFLRRLFEINELLDGHYAEPYAGGAALAFILLFEEYASTVHINDVDPGVFAFWHSVLYDTENFVRMVNDVPLSIQEWQRQSSIQKQPADHSLLDVGFATFYLNRTNRSGIISGGGVIGGLNQSGRWKLDARFNKDPLIRRIEKIARYSGRIRLYNLDAAEFIRNVMPKLPLKSLMYADPPYYEQGRRLYRHFYEPSDHAAIADLITENVSQKWIVSYDNHPHVRALYKKWRQREYSLHYSAARRYEGRELMVFGDGVIIPEGIEPVTFSESVS